MSSGTKTMIFLAAYFLARRVLLGDGVGADFAAAFLTGVFGPKMHEFIFPEFKHDNIL